MAAGARSASPRSPARRPQRPRPPRTRIGSFALVAEQAAARLDEQGENGCDGRVRFLGDRLAQCSSRVKRSRELRRLDHGYVVESRNGTNEDGGEIGAA